MDALNDLTCFAITACTRSFSFTDVDPADTHSITLTDGSDNPLPSWITQSGNIISAPPPDNSAVGSYIIKLIIIEATNEQGLLLSHS